MLLRYLIDSVQPVVRDHLLCDQKPHIMETLFSIFFLSYVLTKHLIPTWSNKQLSHKHDYRIRVKSCLNLLITYLHFFIPAIKQLRHLDMVQSAYSEAGVAWLT